MFLFVLVIDHSSRTPSLIEDFKAERETVWHQWRSQPDIWSCKCIFFCAYRPYKESISKEMNNDNDSNLNLHDQMSGWLRYCLALCKCCRWKNYI